MAKAKLVRPDGTTVNIEGTAEEVAVLIERLSSQEIDDIRRSDKRTSTKKSKRAKKGARIPKIAGDLDLSGGENHQSLRDFYSQYKPSSNQERNLVFVYYLKQVAGIQSVTIDHIFTCYRNLKSLKVPGHLGQSLIDTSRFKGWIGTASLEEVELSVPGINFLEHDMKKAEDKDA